MPSVDKITGQVIIVSNTPDFVVVNKPSGLSVHDDDKDGGGLLKAVAELTGVDKLLPVHRLDKMTSGLIVMAKHPEANRLLADQFAQRQVEKYYLAISASKPRKKQGLIAGDMTKARRGAWKLLPSKNNPAQTQFFSYGLGDGLRLFLLRPRTGKTHQIRVALKSLGSAILGDSLYAGDSADRGYLHAYGLCFDWQGERLRFLVKANQGEVFQRQQVTDQLEEIGMPWELKWPKL
ncbi:TIGR01621 family pseudouridine synthase [Maricurvus nonylphenolicus]|uniref:TIGR01621 family pseudouridine synthase n=1 Tax=Maricurvus nonylphenolicus TaxID=1008307 RepID=UPI0036F19BC4